MRQYNAEDILEERERRVELLENLIEKFQSPIVILRINYPGVDKVNHLTIQIMKILELKLESTFNKNIRYKMLSYTAEGPILIAVVNGNGFDIKKSAIGIEEEHPLGRFADIDVYSLDGKGISRSSLGYEGRKCYLCNEAAQICVRSKAHSKQEIVNFIEEKYKDYMYMQCSEGI